MPTPTNKGKEHFWDKVYKRFIFATRRLNDRQLMMLLACAVGIVVALATYLFEILLYWIKHGLTSWFPEEQASYLYLIYPIMGIIIATVFIHYAARGEMLSGITRVLYSMSSKNSRLKPHNAWAPLVGGAFTIGFGGSVGPEAPIVLSGASIGSNIGQMARLNYKQTTLLLCCGAGAAVASIFKAPIAGLVFVLEILMLDITANSVVPLLISTVSATTLSFFLRGFDPLIAVTVTDKFEFGTIPMYLLLGLLCGLLAFYFTTVNSWVQKLFARIKHQYVRWILGGVIIGGLIFFLPTLYGEGYESFSNLMHGDTGNLMNSSMLYHYRDVPWVIAAVLLVTLLLKVFAMSATTASGGVGGTFAPSLFVGAYAGALVAFVCNHFFGMHLPIVSFTLVGMAGVMAGVMNAPLTSIFLIAELSNGYGLFIPLMIVTMTSFAIDYYLDPDSIYTKQLRQRGELLTHNKDTSVMVFLHLKDLMETDFLKIDENYTLGDLVKIVQNGRRNIFPVVDSDDHLLGVVQLDDIREDMFKPDHYSNKITDYMIQPPEKILQGEQIASILPKFDENATWMLPVVNKDNVYQGFISKSRILAAYREQLVNITQ